MSITLTLPAPLESQVQQVAQREGIATDAYIVKLLQWHLSTTQSALPASEATLLQQINLGLSPATWQRYHELVGKLEDETLQPDEQQALITITNQLEQANVRRLAALIKLAQLRDITLDQLIDQLGLRPPTYA